MRIRNKFTTIMLLSALFPLAIAMGLALWNSTHQTRDLTLEVAQGRLDTAAQKLSGFFSERIAEVSLYSQLEVLKTMDFSAIRPLLMSELVRHGDIYEKFILGTPKGHFYNTSGGNPGAGGLRTFDDGDPDAKPKHIRKRDYWQQTVGSNADSQQRTYVSDPMISYTTGAKQIVVASTILSDEGVVRGMIGGALPWKDIQSRVKRVDDELVDQLGRDARFFLLSHTGTYWYHWDPSHVVNLKRDAIGRPVLNEIGEKVVIKNRIQEEAIAELVAAGERMLKGESGHTSYIDPASGQTRYVAFSPIPSANYSIGIVVPEGSIMAPVQDLQSMFVFIFLIAAAFVSLVALMAARKISTPVVSLNEMAKQLSQGNWSIKLERRNSNDEIAELTGSFNTMADSLEKRELALKQSEGRLANINTELESRIAERTGELENTNAVLTRQIADRIAAEGALRESEELLQNTGHMAHVGGWKLDMVSGELSWTEETYKIHELESGRPIGLDLARAYLCADFQGVFDTAISHAMEQAKPFDLELLLNLAGSGNKWVRLLGRAVEQDGKVTELVGAYQDISELRRVAEMKDEFVSTISHELRTPLTSISGSISLLLSDKVGELDETARNLLGIADRNSERLLLLINDLLDMDKIESGKMEFNNEPTALVQVLERALLDNEPYARKFDVCFALDADVPQIDINVDSGRFLQVMANLMSNAAKFSEPGSCVDVFAALEDGDRVRISVQDHGVGVPESAGDKIFSKFTQADGSDARQQGGTGLGLSISKSMVEAMGGEIGYESEAGKGATFYLLLPVVACSRMDTDMPGLTGSAP